MNLKIVTISLLALPLGLSGLAKSASAADYYNYQYQQSHSEVSHRPQYRRVWVAGHFKEIGHRHREWVPGHWETVRV